VEGVVQVRALLGAEAVYESAVVVDLVRGEDLIEATGRRRKRIDLLSGVLCS